MVSFWEVMDRAINTGELMDMEAYDMKIFQVASRVVAKYGIRYNKSEPLPDADTVQKVFQAAVEAYAELGTYCINSRRVIRFTREEIEEAVRDSLQFPRFVNIGAGREARILEQRRPFDKRPPLCIGGVVESNPNEGRDFVQLYKSILQEPVIDGTYFGPAPHSCEGRPWIVKTPFEIQAARNAVGWVREAARSVGRPGIHLLDATPMAIGIAANLAAGPDQGLRQTDAVAIATISELKVDFDQLNKVALTQQHGCLRNPYWTTVIGGFAGGPEGAAVIGAAHALSAMLVYRVTGSGYCVVANIVQNPAMNTDRQSFWSRSASMQAITSNTSLICGGGGCTSAGPGTEQMLWEVAGLAIVHSTGGGHVIHGCRKAVLTCAVQGTGLEPRWEAEVAKACAGMPRDEMNRILNLVLGKYEDTIKGKGSPNGFGFHDLYDTVKLVPKPEYKELYLKVKSELAGFGLKALK